MQRELPIFEPNSGAGGHHGTPEPITIAMGGGSFGRAADGSNALRRHPDWIRAKLPSGENYHDLKRLLRESGHIPTERDTHYRPLVQSMLQPA